MKKTEYLCELDNYFRLLNKGKESKFSLMELLFMSDLSIEELTKEEILLLYKDTSLLSPLHNKLKAIMMGDLGLDTCRTRTNRWMK
jgi:hypothetical protein